jgi:hypothetical protein
MQTQKYSYAELGYKTQKNLNKVRGRKLAKLSWEEFSELPEFKATMAGRKFNKEDLEDFRLGFERDRKSDG